MAARRKTKSARHTRPNKAKPSNRTEQRSSRSRLAAKAKVAKKVVQNRRKRLAAKKRSTPKPIPVETVIVERVEEPFPGVVVVTEYETVVERPTPPED